jgi:glycosyltransferase involved in cell wall biosynthesis
MIELTVSIPCFGRPQRTKRAIECLLSQNVNNWEAFIMGDACPYFQNLIDSNYLEQIKKEQLKKGNIIHYFNAKKNGGGWGHKLTNYAIEHATGEYFIFYDNDDIILPNHFENYLSEIKNTEYDMVYYNSHLAPFNEDRETILAPSCIGHCDVIIKTKTAKTILPHSEKYTHDWDFIYELTQKGKYKKSTSKLTTYRVMRLGSGPSVDNLD